MSILNNLRRVHAAVVIDNTKSQLQDPNLKTGPLATKINQAAVLALTSGMNSQAWEDYMATFAGNETELKRLTEVEDNEKDYLPQLRAYIVSNAICDIGTSAHTSENVDERIDLGFTAAEMAENAAFIAKRKIKIPPIQ